MKDPDETGNKLKAELRKDIATIASEVRPFIKASQLARVDTDDSVVTNIVLAQDVRPSKEKEEEEEVPQFEKWVAYGPAKRAFFVGFR